MRLTFDDGLHVALLGVDVVQRHQQVHGRQRRAEAARVGVDAQQAVKHLRSHRTRSVGGAGEKRSKYIHGLNTMFFLMT